jgi:hypothetical protein
MTALWLLSVVLLVWGIVCVVRREVVVGVVLILLGLVVGPGAFPVFG